MDLLANELSVHEQFRDLNEFRGALARLMAVRATARRFDRELQCHRAFLNTKPIPNVPIPQAIGNIGVESQRRAVMSWLSRSGPFWDDVRRHGEDDWLECDDLIVTDTAVGEAAFRSLTGEQCGLVSLTPSSWCFSPLELTWVRQAAGLANRKTKVENWWSAEALEAALLEREQPLGSWDDLREASQNRFVNLTFSHDCFVPLAGVPFAKSAADRIVVLLDVLDRFASAFDGGGARNAEGHRIYADYFTGERALFSDSSDSEKQRFKSELTFAHPDDPSSTLSCTWHGKVSHLTLRLHFSWPVEAGEPVYIVYAGPKITKL